MSLQTADEPENTRAKLRMLEDQYESTLHRPTENPLVRQLTLRSLGRLINQLKEEIARYEAHQPARR